MLVFAFDRDWTVDVNPHPSREAVPLEWVRQLAHDTAHAVYAIGNQALADEAAVPGVVDIVGMHPDDRDDWLGDKRPDGRYGRFPTRRERLDLIADLHPDADGHVVVDDLDLSDVDGWDHYHAWGFVPAVERGEIDPDLPWIREVATDGGTSRGTMPSDVEDLRSFVEDVDRGFLRVEHSGETTIVRSLEYTTSDPIVHPFEMDLFEGWRLEEPVGHRLLCHFDDIRTVHVERPESHVGLLPGIRDAIREKDEPHESLPGAMADIAEERPGEVAPHVDVIVPLLSDDSEAVRRAATRCVSFVAAEDPESVVETVPELESMLLDREAMGYVAYALSGISEAYPEAVEPAAPTLAANLTAPSLSEGVKLNLASALGRVVGEYPDIGADRVDDFVTLLDAENPKLRNNGIGLLGDVALVHTDLVEPYVDDIVALFPTDDDCTRINATAALARVAEDFSASIEQNTSLFVDLLDDDHYVVRKNACRVLGHLRADESTDALETARNDEHEEVRTRAQWALDHVEGVSE